MKNSEYYIADITKPFEIETIEQWIKHNFQNTNAISCSDKQFKIIWFTKGTGYFNTETKLCVNPSSVICLDALVQNKLSIDAISEGYIVSFTEDFLNIGELEFDLNCQCNLLRQFSGTQGVFVNDQLANDLNEIITRLIKEYDSHFMFKTEILKRYLKIFLIYLTRQFKESIQLVSQTRNRELVQKFVHALEVNYRNKKKVAEYAKMLFVTPNYLNEIVKKITGYAASYHIRKRVTVEAKRMALYSEYSMKEVAYTLGFQDCAHFSKFFKASTNNNFSDFKKERLTTASLYYPQWS